MAGTPEGPIDEWPLDDGGELDAILGLPGLPLEPDERLRGQSSDAQIYVSVAGDARSVSWAMGLEEDVRLLAEAFAAGGAALAHEVTGGLLSRSSSKTRKPDRREDVAVALDGLMLDPGDEEELRGLIRMLVESRIAGESARS
jgi:hypothetical protein